MVARGLTLATSGLFIGALGAWASSRALSTMLYDVKPTAPVVFVATGTGLLAVAIVASYLPARVAGRVDPMTIWRET